MGLTNVIVHLRSKVLHDCKESFLVHAHPDPRSFRPDTETLPSPAQASQAETQEEYIARIVSEAPPISRETLDRLAVLLGPTIRQHRANATPGVTVADWVKWENKRYVEATETPGIHGTYGNEVAA